MYTGPELPSYMIALKTLASISLTFATWYLFLEMDSSSCQSDTVFYLTSEITSFIKYLLSWQKKICKSIVQAGQVFA